MIRNEWTLPALLLGLAWMVDGWVGVIAITCMGSSFLVAAWSLIRVWRGLRADQQDRVLAWRATR